MVRHGSVWHLTAYFLGWRRCISDYIQWRNRYTRTNHSTPSLVVSCEVPPLLVTKFRSINFSCVWLGQDSCRLCKVESFIFIWGCLALISRLGWRHRVSSSLFFNTRIVSYRDVKKKVFAGANWHRRATMAPSGQTIQTLYLQGKKTQKLKIKTILIHAGTVWTNRRVFRARHFPDPDCRCVAPI